MFSERQSDRNYLEWDVSFVLHDVDFKNWQERSLAETKGPFLLKMMVRKNQSFRIFKNLLRLSLALRFENAATSVEFRIHFFSLLTLVVFKHVWFMDKQTFVVAFLGNWDSPCTTIVIQSCSWSKIELLGNLSIQSDMSCHVAFSSSKIRTISNLSRPILTNMEPYIEHTSL